MARLIQTVNGETSSLEVCESPEEYAEYIESIPLRIREAEYGRGSWGYGNYDDTKFKKALYDLRYGDLRLAEKAEKLMEQLTYEGIMSVGLPMPSRAVTGAMTILPLYEAGIPNCMITREMSELRGVNTPLNVYWDRFASGGLSDHDIQRRGIAITAFVMAMNNIRPVNLYFVNTSCPSCAAYGERGIYGGLIRMETRPLDLARATWMFTDPNFSRLMPWMAMRHQFELTHKRHANSAYGPIRLRYNSDTAEYGQEFRDILKMEQDDILLYGMSLLDPLSYTNPVAWVQRMIKEHTQKVNEDE